jgi:hypothetical protein
MKKQKKKQNKYKTLNKIYLVIIFILIILLNKNNIKSLFNKFNLLSQKNYIIEQMQINANRKDKESRDYIEQLQQDLEEIEKDLKN